MKRMMLHSMLIAAVILLCIAVLLFAVGRLSMTADTDERVVSLRPKVVVDAGHGGFDGGAVAPDGTMEKELNLAIALPLADFLTLYGFDVTLTRDTDTGLHDDDSMPIRQKKVSDMQKRLGLYEQADLNISIHQNMFSAAAYHGAQMFYSENHPLSGPLATCIRDEVYTRLQPENTRELKTGNRDIYLLYKTTKPTVLVECGFLSNAEELHRLQSQEYRQSLAFAIANGALCYVQKYLSAA